MSTSEINATTVDAIIERNDKLLLVLRGNEPFKYTLALPGGFVDYGEKVEDAVVREVREELSVDAVPAAILGVYSGPNRDPRGPVISTVFVCKISGDPKAGDDAASYEWKAMSTIEKQDMAFDHFKIVSDYMKWKKTRETFWTDKVL